MAIGVFFDNREDNTFQAKGFLIDSDILLGFLNIEGSSILSSSIDFKYVYNLSFGRNFFEYKINWQQSFFDEKSSYYFAGSIRKSYLYYGRQRLHTGGNQ